MNVSCFFYNSVAWPRLGTGLLLISTVNYPTDQSKILVEVCKVPNS